MVERRSGRPLPHGPPGMQIGEPERARDRQGTLRRIWGYLKRQGRGLVGVLLLVAVASGLDLLGPYLLGLAIDEFILKNNLPGLGRIALLMLVVNLMGALVTWLQVYVMSAVAQSAVRDIRRDLFARFQTLSLHYIDQRPHGELMSRLTNDVENISVVLSDSVTQLFSSVLGIIGVTVVMFMINVRLAVVSLVTLPLMALISRYIAQHTRRGFREQQEHLGILNGIIEETVTGQRVVKAYGREEAAIDQFDNSNLHLRRASTRAQIFSGLMGPLNNFVNNIGFAIIAGAGGWMAMGGIATIGNIASFVNYARQFTMPLNQIANLYNAIQSALAGAERVFAIIDEPSELEDSPDSLPLEQVHGEVRFSDVYFGYNPNEPVLKQVSLHARSGQTIALVGPTGAGKTTIVNLLSRFYDVDSGAISIDGVDIRRLQKQDVRRKLGIVLQDTFLFADSVMENIRYGRLDATDDEVRAAARLANAEQFILRLPHGYQSQLSERAGNLSLGQRQLLAIARAILADPAILILDEATSSVDTRTEKHIQEAMLRLMKGRTSFVIAHRLSTIREADLILVIYHGEIVEQGTHRGLLEKQGFYARLYTSQFKGQQHLVTGLV
jgi:ATP-binding cassette, subfamily B, multidrug efflux pump